MRGDRARNLFAPARDGQAFRVRDRRNGIRCDRRARRPFAARCARVLRLRGARRLAGLLVLLPARRLALLPARVGRTIRVPGRRRFCPRRRGTFRETLKKTS
ncbi:hypothetical protein QZM01_08170 [Burkholderia multivorans]|nr:hypothetical protein [Burkholderia multivorans]